MLHSFLLLLLLHRTPRRQAANVILAGFIPDFLGEISGLHFFSSNIFSIRNERSHLERPCRALGAFSSGSSREACFVCCRVCSLEAFQMLHFLQRHPGPLIAGEMVLWLQFAVNIPFAALNLHPCKAGNSYLNAKHTEMKPI